MANAIDIVPLDVAQRYVSGDAPGNIDASQMADLITSVSEMFDELCGAVITRSVTESLDGGGPSVWPSASPIVAVTTLTEYSGVSAQVLTLDTNTVNSANGFLIDGARIFRRSGGAAYWFPDGSRNIEVTYTAGRGTQATVPRRFVSAALITIQAIWVREHGIGSVAFGEVQVQGATFALPNAALEMIRKDINRSGAISRG